MGYDLTAFGAQLSGFIGAANYAAGLDASTLVPTAQLASGATSTTVFLRGDRTWAAPPSTAQIFKQQVTAASTTVVTANTALPHDNTPPQSTEGAQFLVGTITPNASGNTLVVDTMVYVASNDATLSPINGALFVDASTSAVTAASIADPILNTMALLRLVYVTTTADTSAHAFKIRVGDANADTITLNGENGAGLFGNLVRSTITMYEMA